MWSGMMTYHPTSQSVAAFHAAKIQSNTALFARIGLLFSVTTVTYSIIERLSWYVITELRDGWRRTGGKCSCASAAVSHGRDALPRVRAFSVALERAPPAGSSFNNSSEHNDIAIFLCSSSHAFEFCNHRLQNYIWVILQFGGQRPPNFASHWLANCNWPCRLREGRAPARPLGSTREGRAPARPPRFHTGGTRPCASAAFRSRWSAPLPYARLFHVSSSSRLQPGDVPWNLLEDDVHLLEFRRLD